MSIGFGLERLGFLTLRHPRIVAIAVLAFTALCLAQLPHVRVDGDIVRVFRDSGEQYDRYQKLQDTFGTFENDAYLLVTSPDLTDPEVLEDMRSLGLELQINEYAVGTLSPFVLRQPGPNNVSVPAVPENLQTRDEVKKALTKLRETDPIMRNLITPDLTGIVLIMFPDQDRTRSSTGEADMLASLRELVAYYQTDNVNIEITGPPVWKSEMLDASVSDQVTFSVAGFLVGAFFSLLVLRSVWAALLATLPSFLSVIWVIGTVTMLFGSFTFLTNVVTTLVLVIAFAESMYLCFTWLRLWRDGMDPHEAITQAMRRVTPAAALTTITTMVSFATLIFTQGRGIEEFGVSGVLASAITYIILVTALPLALRFAVAVGFKPPKTLSIAVSLPIPLAKKLSLKHSLAVTIIAVCCVLGLLYPHFVMQPRFNFQDFLPGGSDSLETAASIDQGVGGVAPVYVVVPLSGDLESVNDTDYAKIRDIHHILESIIGQGKVISAASFEHYEAAGFTRQQIFDSVGPFLKQRFVTDDGTKALVTGFVPTVLKSADLRDIVAKADSAFQQAGYNDLQLTGFNVLTAMSSTDIIGSMRNGLTAAIAINICVIGFAFRSLKVALVSIIPNFLPILGTELYLYVSGAGLQLTTVMALTIAFGIAVDDTIHFLATYMRARSKGEENKAAVSHTLESIGPALVATTIILCAGTSVVMLSSLPQVAIFGALTVLTLILALIGDLVVLPSLLAAGTRMFRTLGAPNK